MDNSAGLKVELHETERRLLAELRTLRHNARASQGGSHPVRSHLTIGQKDADSVASTMGSWRFIIIQSIILLVWIAL